MNILAYAKSAVGLSLSFVGMVLLAFAVSLVGSAHAEEPLLESIREKLSASIGVKVESVSETPFENFYEGFAGGQIVYTNRDVSMIVVGALIDPATMTNLTAQRLGELTAVPFDDLPLEDAIKIVRGKGTRVMASFEDPNCGYCRKFVRDSTALKDVTIYTFLMPMLSDDSWAKSRAVWCAKDREKAWTELMTAGKSPALADQKCDTSVLERNVALGRSHGIHGTPTLIFADGTRVPGAIPAAQIEVRLSATPSRR